MGANPHANGGVLLHDLRLPDFATTRWRCRMPGSTRAEATRVMGAFSCAM
jgi:xylulose-5-phosphate/fructose-6-phosphate phosphoketolase